ncbi:MAG: ATP-binding protein [Terriglobales bacterium]
MHTLTLIERSLAAKRGLFSLLAKRWSATGATGRSKPAASSGDSAVESLQRIADFSHDGEKLFLLLHGAGATGKTRLMLQAGASLAETGTQVLWAEAASMARSSNWFLTLPRERPTVLLLDEPDDPDLLKVLLEQLSQPGARWKVVVAVRSPNDPVVGWLTRGQLAARTATLELSGLSKIQASEALQGMLDTTDNKLGEEGATEVARFLDGFPGWLEIAARLITRNSLQHLPTSTSDMARQYLHEILYSQKALPAEPLKCLLRQVALYGRVNRQDAAAVAGLAEQCGLTQDEVLTALNEQVRRRVLVERGAYDRLVDIKPDVMRDFILQDWLTIPATSHRWEVSQDAVDLSRRAGDLLRSEDGTREANALLQALGRTELMLRLDGKNIDLLGGFFNEIETQAAGALPSHLMRLVDAVQAVAEVRPGDAVRVSRLFRGLAPQPEELGLIRKWTIGKAEVIGKLPWMLFHAARGAEESTTRSALLNEVLEIAVLQGTAERRSGDNAVSLIPRIIAGGPDVGFDYTAEAGAIALHRLDALAAGTSSSEEALASRILLDPLVSAERTQTWADAGSFHVAKLLISNDSLAGGVRAKRNRRGAWHPHGFRSLLH